MEQFDIKKIGKQLKKINADNGKDVNAGVQLVMNNMELYNTLLGKMETGQVKTMYLLYQVSSTIFNQLREFNIFPDKKAMKQDADDFFNQVKSKVEKR